ncbi:hypothetical protein ATOBIA_N00410 [Atopobiaceae bacterium P1]|uniref:Uncharacterized protein n=1 Tax=Leptogranulimonas caecicola TaxID=2894156 RepID=A0AAU9D511_9ACTN|nr:hypothetical protein ATOBIA_N00410 [Atopobiaceae bacterium P1]BDC90169.1 hypothetical protein ATTO_00410 [Leptogranulimonas caecicola]
MQEGAFNTEKTWRKTEGFQLAFCVFAASSQWGFVFAECDEGPKTQISTHRERKSSVRTLAGFLTLRIGGFLSLEHTALL